MLKNIIPKVSSANFLPKTVNLSLEIIDSKISFQECKKALVFLLDKEGYIKWHEQSDIPLASGALSNFYCDIKEALANDRIGKALVAMLLKLLDQKGYGTDKNLVVASNGVGGALVIGKVSVSRENISDFVDRLKIKEYGTKERAIGKINQDQMIILVDDVLSTGGNMRKTLEYLRTLGHEPAALFVIVNRSNSDGQKLIEEIGGIPVHSIFTTNDFSK